MPSLQMASRHVTVLTAAANASTAYADGTEGKSGVRCFTSSKKIGITTSEDSASTRASVFNGMPELPRRSFLDGLKGHLAWLKYMLMALPIWAYQSALYIFGVAAIAIT